MANKIVQLHDENGNNLYPISSYFVTDAVLLWTNSSPSSTFAAQTVELDLSPYKMILIEVMGDTSDTTYRIPSSMVFYIDGLQHVMPYGVSNRYRKITPSSTGIVFTTGSQAGSSDNAKYGAPYKIYGIK